jgi:membrane protein
MHTKTLWSVTTRAVWAWWADNCMRLSASLAFYTALSLAPLVMIVVGLAGVVTERQLVASQLARQMELLMGPPGRQLVGIIVSTTEPGGGAVAAVIGFVTLLLGATTVFGELQAALNLIWEVKPAPLRGAWAMLWSWLKQRSVSLAMVLTIAFLLLVSLVVSAILAGVTQYFRHDLAPGHILLGHLLEGAISIAVITLLFALLFKYVPDAQIRWRDVWLGGGASAVLFTLGKVAIGYYIGRVAHRAVGVGLLLHPDRLLWRRVHARLGHAPGRRGDTQAARRGRCRTADQERGRRRALMEPSHRDRLREQGSRWVWRRARRRCRIRWPVPLLHVRDGRRVQRMAGWCPCRIPS